MPQFSWICAEFAAASCPTNLPCRPTPALFTRMSIVLPRSLTFDARSGPDPGSARSAAITSTVRSGCRSVSVLRSSASFSARRATSTRFTPRFANWTANSSPIPPLDPVINAVLFFRSTRPPVADDVRLVGIPEGRRGVNRGCRTSVPFSAHDRLARGERYRPSVPAHGVPVRPRGFHHRRTGRRADVPRLPHRRTSVEGGVGRASVGGRPRQGDPAAARSLPSRIDAAGNRAPDSYARACST